MKKKSLSFAAIFKTKFITNELATVVSHPVRISVFKGAKVYQIPKQTAYRFPKEDEQVFAVVESLNLPEDHYVEIKVRTEIQDVDNARAFCEAEIDRTIAMLVSVYNLHFFDELVYKGWLIKNNWGVLGGWTQRVDEPKIQIDTEEIESSLLKIHRHLHSHDDLFDRFTLMSRFLSKSLSYTNTEEKFLLLWTALEVFPMKDTSNIEAISHCLSKILNMDVARAKEKLEIGKLYGTRCSLVHDGKFTINEISTVSLDKPDEERRYEYAESDTFARLEYIVREIMRYMCGLPYSGSLDRYL